MIPPPDNRLRVMLKGIRGPRENRCPMPFRLNRALIMTVFAAFYGVLSFAPAAATLQSLQTGMQAPDFSLKTINGEAKSFADVKGEKLTVLVFWSTWNPKSEKILARMQQLHEKYKRQGLSVIGVNADGQNISDETLAAIRAFSDKLKIGFPILIDRGLVAFHDYGVIALPSTVILNGERVISFELSGYPLMGAETLDDFVASTIEGKKAASAGRRPATSRAQAPSVFTIWARPP